MMLEAKVHGTPRTIVAHVSKNDVTTIATASGQRIATIAIAV